MGRDVITIEEADPSARAECGACDWGGPASQLEAPDGAILTPGDPSPAGRCPECGALAYLAEAEPAPAPTMPHPLPLYARVLEAGDRLQAIAENGPDTPPGTPDVAARIGEWCAAKNTLHPAVAAYSALAAIQNQAERQIVATLIGDALASGYRVSVNDGGETTVHHSTDPAAIGTAMGTTAEDVLMLHDAVGIRIGWVLLIWGNAEHVVSDYSIGDPRMDALVGEGSAVDAMETLFGA
jgi:hypothetical protein